MKGECVDKDPSSLCSTLSDPKCSFILHQNFPFYLFFYHPIIHFPLLSPFLSFSLPLFFSPFPPFYSLKLVEGGRGLVLLIEILYRVSMGIVNFVERDRKTARVNE